MKPTCSELDEYLNDQLPPDARGAFEVHLASCAECRRECELDRTVYALLRRAASEFEVPPSRLVAAIEARLRIVTRRRLAWVVPTALAAAAILFAAIRVLVTHQSQHDSLQRAVAAGQQPGTRLPTDQEQRTELPDGARTDAQPLVKLIFDPTHDVIALPVATDDPNVSIFWLYPIQTSAQDSNVPENESTEELPRSKT